MGKQRYTTEEIIHKLGEVNVLIGQGQTVIPRPRRRRLYGFRSKTSCRLNDIHDAPHSGVADSSIPVSDGAAIAQRKVFICYYQVGGLLFDVEVKSV
jgi:hypothetical protein